MPVISLVPREQPRATTWSHDDLTSKSLPFAPATGISATVDRRRTPTPTSVAVVTLTISSVPVSSGSQNPSSEIEGGAIVGSLVGFAILVLLILCCRSRRSGNSRNNRKRSSTTSSPKQPDTPYPGPPDAPHVQFPAPVYEAKSARRPSRYIRVIGDTEFLVVRKPKSASRPGRYSPPESNLLFR